MEVEIPESDLEITTTRSQGAGGCTRVLLLIHAPTLSIPAASWSSLYIKWLYIMFV